MTHYEINQALINHLLSLPSLPKVIYENSLPTSGDLFLKLHDIPVNTTLETFDYNEEKTGIFQISVYGQRDSGNKQVLDLCDKIINHFKYKSINNVTVLNATLSSALLDDKHYQKAISINYNFQG